MYNSLMIPYLSIFITILLFSSIEVFSKMLTGHIDPYFIAFLRFFVSGVILILIDLKRMWLVTKKDLAVMALLGVVGITIALGSFHLAITGLEASTAAVIFSMNPIFSSLFATFFLKEHINKNKVLGILVGFCGVYLVIFGFSTPEWGNIKNILLMFIAAVGFGLYIAASKPYVKRYGTFFTTGFIFISGALPYLLFINNYTIGNFSQSLPIITYLSLITTGLAYTLYFYGLKRVPVLVGSSMFYLKPVFATILAILLLGESPSVHFYIGVGIILSGMALTMKRV